MKKLGSILALVGLSLMLGMAITVTVTPEAQAYWCYQYSWHIINVGGDCVCNDGDHGNLITGCSGYNQDGSDCYCYTFCSACPPHHKKGPYPAIYVPPGEGDR